MLVESLFAGMDNSFSLQFMRGEVPVDLMNLFTYKLNLSNGREFTDQALFIEKSAQVTTTVNGESVTKVDPALMGIVEIVIGPLLTEADKGTHTCWITSYDPVNVNGVRWPNFKLKVK